MARLRAQVASLNPSSESLPIRDDYEAAEESRHVLRLKTGIAYDDIMALHKCEWDDNYPENPQRYHSIMCRLNELHLVERCVRIPEIQSVLSSVPLVHSTNQLLLLHDLRNKDQSDLMSEAGKYDAIYFNESTEAAAKAALSLTYGLVQAVAAGTVQNGLAVVRPPGHHAMHSQFCGYCYLNNVAVVARAILNDVKISTKKILVFDFDVHHGQGTQQMFYDTNEVLYISIHRYEHGNFWPNLRQSNYDFIGKPNTPGYGFNVNIPLNTTGCGDAEYMAIFTNIVLPLAFEFQPDLVVLSAGYDACVGCPEGEMLVTPAWYGHIIKLLSGMAHGKLAVILEGGYYLPSLAEGVALSLKALLDDPPGLLDPLGAPNASVTTTINNVIGMLHPFWKCFNHMLRPPTTSDSKAHELHIRHDRAAIEPPFLTSNCYPVQSHEVLNKFEEIMNRLRPLTSKLSPLKVGYTYDSAMLDHKPGVGDAATHPECPERLEAVYELFTAFKLDERCQRIVHSAANVSELLMEHDENYLSSLHCPNVEGGDAALSGDIYISEKSCEVAAIAAGCTLHLSKAVMNGEVGSGIALVRPPGHHAERSTAAGFCLVNNIAVAAKWIKQQYPDARIMIIDFDIHHGNGTQKSFYDDDSVLFISIHKFDQGKFYPSAADGGANFIGEGKGIGYNINVPFNNGKMCDADYFAVFQSIVLPIAYSFAPTVVLVSAGFDAGINDRLGNYSLSPQAFGHFIQLLRPLAKGRLILSMEGGYNIWTLKYGVVMCIKALLGDPLPAMQFAEACREAKETINEVLEVLRPFWPVLHIVLPLSSKVATVEMRNGDKHCVFYEEDKVKDALNLGESNRQMYPREFSEVPTYN